MIEDFNDDGAFEARLADGTDPRWQEFFGWDITRTGLSEDSLGLSGWYQSAYELGVVQMFRWMEWAETVGKPLFDSRELASASIARCGSDCVCDCSS